MRDWLKKNHKRPKTTILKYAFEISSGLKALHEKGVVHKDIKPENILLDILEDGNGGKPLCCVIADFGIAQIVKEDILKVSAFQMTQIKGLSLKYAAPERIVIWKQGHSFCDVAMVYTWDTYALGLIMFELLTNAKLFDYSVSSYQTQPVGNAQP